MKRAVFVLALLLCAAPLAAQDRNVDFTLWASWVDMQGTNTIGEGFETEFDSGSGFGLSTAWFFSNHLAAEVAVFALRSDATFSSSDFEPFDLGRVELLPVTVGLQFHLAGQSRFDPYIGGGAAYVMADDLESQHLIDLGAGTIELDDEFTYFANAGLGIHFTDGFALALDARYIPYETTSTSSVTGEEEELEFNPLIVSAGLRFRF